MVKCEEEEKSPTENTIVTSAWREENKVKSVSCANCHDSMNKAPLPAPRKTIWGFVKDVEKYYRNS